MSNFSTILADKKIVKLDDMHKIMDIDFIFKTVGKSTNGKTATVFRSNIIHNWVYFNNDTNEICKFSFDDVICYQFNGFHEVRHSFLFFLDETYITDVDFYKFAPNVETLNILLNERT